ncbi:MAG: hypothetical protein HQK66_01810 [Desulfamplus sp.]|nr:hypothetical protein [Desulfamplus sp.]
MKSRKDVKNDVAAVTPEEGTETSANSEVKSEECNRLYRYETARAIRDTRDALKKRVDSYNEKYIKGSLESGREFMKELQDDPLKKIDALVDEGTKKIKTLKSDSLKRYDDVKSKSKDISAKLKEKPFKYAGEVVKEIRDDADRVIEKYKEKSRKVINTLEKDIEIARKEFVDNGKKAIEKLPMKKRAEEKINATIEKFPSIFNLPSKKEVEELIKGVDNVSRKVDSLARHASAA